MMMIISCTNKGLYGFQRLTSLTVLWKIQTWVLVSSLRIKKKKKDDNNNNNKIFSSSKVKVTENSKVKWNDVYLYEKKEIIQHFIFN